MRFLVILTAILFVFIASPVWADGDPGIVAEVNIIGVNPDAYVNLYGDNPDVYINGKDIDQTIGQAVSGAVQQSVPNGVWGNGNTGMLPPLAAIPEINAIAPGKYTQPVIGGMGYIGPITNESPFVYKGSGCGMWGVSDGYPDLWGRRQMVGVTVDLTIQREKLAQTQTALVKVIGEIQNNNASIGTVNTQLSESLDTLSGVVTDLAVIEEENLQFRERTLNKINDMNNTLIIIMVCCSVGFFVTMVGFLVVFKRKK
jgi:hypothetical protein